MIIIETCPECGHDLRDEVICTYPPIPRKACYNCGWSWEGEQEEVVRIPFGGNSLNVTDFGNSLIDVTGYSLNNYLNNLNSEESLVGNFGQSACVNCSNNPKNGGSGNCNCTLGLPRSIC